MNVVLALILTLFILTACSSNNNNVEPTPEPSPTPTVTPTPEPTPTPNDGVTPALVVEPADIVLRFLAYISAGDIAGAYALSDATMQNAGIGRAIEIYNFTRGEITDFSIGSYQTQGDFTIFTTTVTRTLGTASFNVVLNAGGEVVGFHSLDDFVSATTPPLYELPTYTSESVIIGEGTEWALNGMLTLPVGASADTPVPGVVLVHGSGAHDMDMTIWGHRLFFDVADFLSENGIAVLRYDKRNFVHHARLTQTFGSSFTVWEEVIEDAVLGAQLLRADPRISEVYMLGWSLGGVLAPRIHASGGNFDGLILFAGSSRTLVDIVYDQFMDDITRALGIFGELPELTAMLEEIESFAGIAASIPMMTDDEAKSTTVPILGGYAYYLKEMMANPFEYFVENITVPMLVMQGRNDFQVLAGVDFALLQELLGERDNVAFMLYDYLDHFFMPSIAANFSEHRDVAMMRLLGTRVYERALRDVVEWMLAQ